MLDEVLRRPLDFLIDFERTFDPSSMAGVLVSDLKSSVATVGVFLVVWRLRVFLALVTAAMAQDVRSRPREV